MKIAPLATLLIGAPSCAAWINASPSNGSTRAAGALRPSGFSLHAIGSAGFGSSDASDVDAAVAESIAIAKQEVGDDVAMAFVSCTADADVPLVQQEFQRQLQCSNIHGITSSGGVLTKQSGSIPNAVGCLLMSADAGDFVTSYHASDAAAAVRELEASGKAFRAPGDGADAITAPPLFQAIFMSATPGMEEEVIDAIEEAFPNTPIYGGTAADNDLSGKWMVFGSDVKADDSGDVTPASGTGISLVGIGADVKMGASMIGPYQPTQRKVTATKTDGRRVYELDGQPAADWVYNEWLGDEVKEAYENGGLILGQTAQRPIAFEVSSGGASGPRKLLQGRKKSAQPDADPEYITAHLAALGGPDEKFVEFFTPIPEGSELTVMDSGDGPSTGYAAALETAYDAASAGVSVPKAGLLVYCGGMAIAVGDQLNDGLLSPSYQQRLGNMPMMGMTCFGEQTCTPQSNTNVQRNLSVGMVLFE